MNYEMSFNLFEGGTITVTVDAARLTAITKVLSLTTLPQVLSTSDVLTGVIVAFPTTNLASIVAVPVAA